MFLTKSQKSDSTLSGIESVRAHIDRLANDAVKLQNRVDKLDEELQQNRLKVIDTDKEYANARAQEIELAQKLEAVWKAKDGIKTRQRNLYRKQDQMEKEHLEKWREYKETTTLVRSLRSIMEQVFPGPAKRSASIQAVKGPPSKQTKVKGGTFGKGNESFDDEDEPDNKFAAKSGSRTSSLKFEDALRTELKLKDEDKKETK